MMLTMLTGLTHKACACISLTACNSSNKRKSDMFGFNRMSLLMNGDEPLKCNVCFSDGGGGCLGFFIQLQNIQFYKQFIDKY